MSDNVNQTDSSMPRAADEPSLISNDTLFWINALMGSLMVIGGYMGYAKKGSKISLAAGSAICAWYLFAASLATDASGGMRWHSTVCSLLLAAVFSVRFAKSGNSMPAVPILTLSTLTVVTVNLDLVNELTYGVPEAVISQMPVWPGWLNLPQWANTLIAVGTGWVVLHHALYAFRYPATSDVSGIKSASGGPRTGVLLVQLGTPECPIKSKVAPFLREFLFDGRVIDIRCPFLRGVLVKGIIVPFRAAKSTGIYKELWEHTTGCDNKSPLMYHTEQLINGLNPMLAGDDITVHMGMRYQQPSMPSALEEMRQLNYDRIVVFPMFPQYASATNGSVLDKAFEIIRKWWVIPEVRTMGHFYASDFYLDTLIDQALKHDVNTFDAVIMSFHGLPLRHCNKAHPSGKCSAECEVGINNDSRMCYRAQCFDTAKRLAEKLNIKGGNGVGYTVGFQSRLGSGWLEPYTDSIVERMAKEGKKRILCFSPAFVADCLETTVEIGVEYQEIMEEHAGKDAKIVLVESCNSEPKWVSGLAEMIRKACKSH